MFNEIGEKIMRVSRLLVVLVPLLTVISAIAAGLNGDSVWLRLLVGAAAFIGIWPLYGFGQLVQDVHDIRLGDRRINLRDEELPRL